MTSWTRPSIVELGDGAWPWSRAVVQILFGVDRLGKEHSFPDRPCLCL